MDPQPTIGDPRLQGNDPTTGTLYEHDCVLRAGLVDELVWSFVSYEFIKTGQAAPAPPDYANLVSTEIKDQRLIPTSTANFGPDPATMAVKVPIWLWIDAPQVADINLNGLVTARIYVKSTTWSMGDPVNDPDQDTKNKVASFDCDGTGSPAPAEIDPTATPPCSYTYIWKSTKTRTGPTCSWPVQVTVNWQVDWRAADGGAQTGTFQIPVVIDTGARVGEWRAVLVSGEGAVQQDQPSIWADCQPLPGT